MSAPKLQPSEDEALSNFLGAALGTQAVSRTARVEPTTHATAVVRSRINNALCGFATRWTLDGDYLRCRKCNRPHIASALEVPFNHKAGCKAEGNVESHPWLTFLLLLAPLLPPPAPARCDAQTNAARDVLAERQRQISAEGWATEHDDQHDSGELASAAASYAQCAGLQREGAVCENAFKAPYVENWPWSEYWWKPSTDPRRNLVKAGALILAEIERLDRAAIAAQQGKGR